MIYPEITQQQGRPYLREYCWQAHQLAYEKRSEPARIRSGLKAEMREFLPYGVWTGVCLRKSFPLV